MARRLAPPPLPHEPVTVLVRHDAAGGLRRAAATVESNVPGPDATTAWDRLVLERGGLALVDELMAYGADVYVEAPAELRTTIVERLQATVAGEGAA